MLFINLWFVVVGAVELWCCKLRGFCRWWLWKLEKNGSLKGSLNDDEKDPKCEGRPKLLLNSWNCLCWFSIHSLRSIFTYHSSTVTLNQILIVVRVLLDWDEIFGKSPGVISSSVCDVLCTGHTTSTHPVHHVYNNIGNNVMVKKTRPIGLDTVETSVGFKV